MKKKIPNLLGSELSLLRCEFCSLIIIIFFFFNLSKHVSARRIIGPVSQLSAPSLISFQESRFFFFFYILLSILRALWTVRFVWCWSFCFETQEIGEEGLLNRDSGTQKVAEPACRGWGCQRRQLRGHHASPNHGKASAFPRGHYPHQGYIFNPFLSFPLRFPS